MRRVGRLSGKLPSRIEELHALWLSNKIIGSDDPPLNLQIRQSITDSRLIRLIAFALLLFNLMMNRLSVCINQMP